MEVATTSTSQWVYTKKHKPAVFLEKEIIHSRILAWEIPWTEEPSGLQPMGLQKSQTQLSNLTRKLCSWFTWYSLWTSLWFCSTVTQIPRWLEVFLNHDHRERNWPSHMALKSLTAEMTPAISMKYYQSKSITWLYLQMLRKCR